ncbi:AraC family transcriptional regulator [Streptomyces sp. NBRC 14336]|uniref:helix-turn-helix domain-containing protein n=1 Tax=Streptomyces sp. NBRC 14336 TaxID=3030992 RepID=UPI0024A6040B|nr:AraC family transcriptional regulator [Streptomyces sp. NBRC 14336]WBO79607.1 AraC family transcriptional regulator [Streptomyces sp. SBE_14.2]GLW51005.1 AraC family transcriptional regulator [Streptomyces sp. NBRC 14336]
MDARQDDTRGIVDPSGLLSRVRFRRHLPAEPLRPYVEWYWLIDWDLPEPYVAHTVPHPSVNLTFQWDEETGPPYSELTGVALGLYARKLTGRGRVCGVKFRPGAFRPFAPQVPVSHWTGRALPAGEVLRQATPQEARRIVTADGDEARAHALDHFLLSVPHTADPQAELAADLVARIRTDRSVSRVADFASSQGLSVRSLQRLFSAYVGVSPKWTILRYRLHDALDQADSADTDWSGLAATLGYADQSHLVRAFTGTLGVSPTAYARAVRGD